MNLMRVAKNACLDFEERRQIQTFEEGLYNTPKLLVSCQCFGDSSGDNTQYRSELLQIVQDLYRLD